MFWFPFTENIYDKYLRIPASASNNLMDLIQMKGLNCGNQSGEYYRLAHMDELRANCIRSVSMQKLYFN